jgi:hypothetical protein
MSKYKAKDTVEFYTPKISGHLVTTALHSLGIYTLQGIVTEIGKCSDMRGEYYPTTEKPLYRVWVNDSIGAFWIFADQIVKTFDDNGVLAKAHSESSDD